MRYCRSIRTQSRISKVENTGIEKAEKELEFLKNDLPKKNGELAQEIKRQLIDNSLIKENEFSKVKIHFVRLKLDWLKSKALVEYCKFLKSNNDENLTEAIRYSKRVLEFLESDEYEYDEYSFRKKLTYPKPSPNLKSIIGELKNYKLITKLYQYTGYFENDEEKMVIVFPTSLEYYFNYNHIFEKKNGVNMVGHQTGVHLLCP